MNFVKTLVKSVVGRGLDEAVRLAIRVVMKVWINRYLVNYELKGEEDGIYDLQNVEINTDVCKQGKSNRLGNQ